MPMLHTMDQDHKAMGLVSPFLGMLIHPRQTMSQLLTHHAGIGAYSMSLLFVLSGGLALYFGGVQDLVYAEAPVLIFFLLMAGAFFMMSTSEIVKYVSRNYFGAFASGAEIRTALGWSLAPAILCNLMAIALALSPWMNYPLEIVLGVTGLLWSFTLMDHALGEAEAYGDGPAFMVLIFAFASLLLAFAMAYLPLWLLTPFINSWIWYG